MNYATSKIHFEHSGYFFIALLALVLLGFWPSYFSRFFDGTADFTFYFHFHAVIATLWISMLITQPILIRNKKIRWHRMTGRLSYSLLIGLMIRERHQKRGRWVFPLALCLFLLVQLIVLFEVKIGPWQAFAEWFAALPLT